MPAYTANRAVHKTLSGVLVDTVTLAQAEGNLLIVNRDGSNPLWVSYSFDGSIPADPTIAGDDFFYVSPSACLTVESSQIGSSAVRVKLLGNGGAYSVMVAQQGGVDNEIELGPAVAGSSSIGAIAGDVASGSADSGNPVKTGGVARITNPAAVGDGTRVNFIGDKVGRQVVVVGQVRDLVTESVTTITSSVAETTILAAGGTNVFHDVFMITLANSSASGTLVTIRDVTGAGTARVVYVPPTNTITIEPPVPMKQGTANSAWTATCGTSVASLYVAVLAVKNL